VVSLVPKIRWAELARGRGWCRRLRLADVVWVGGAGPYPARSGGSVRLHRDRHRGDDCGGGYLRVQPGGVDRQLAALGTNMLTVGPGQTFSGEEAHLPPTRSG
jgi:hypothetical protein